MPNSALFFDGYLRQLQRAKHLEAYQLLPGLYLAAIDGTDYFSSTSLSCEHCLTTKKKKSTNNADEQGEIVEEAQTIRYSHKALQAAIMHPDKKQVIPLMPEEIRNADGRTKQDCEVNAAKRLIRALRKSHPQLGLIVGGDDLFSRQPMIEEVLERRMDYLFVAKEESHTYLKAWLLAYPQLNTYEVYDKETGAGHVYEWMNDVPLHGGKEAIRVNYFQYYLYRTDKREVEKRVYKNSWVTDIEVTQENVAVLAKGVRCRWKVENECFNTLKNQGYCIERSYGHGKKHLSFNFYLLTLIAFAFHQVFELTDSLYQTCRQALGSKKNLWEHARSYIKIVVFETWEAVLRFVLNPEQYIPERLPG